MVISKSAPESAAAAAKVLSSGRAAIIPCDTIYGIVGRAVDSAPLIRNLKGRGEDKPFIIYILEPRDIAVYSPADPSQPILSLWPGPLTLILPALGEGTVALRCPADPWVRRVLELCGFGIYTTSVNRSGRPAMGRIGEIIAEFGSSVDLIIDGGDMEGGLPSTIVDACEKPYRVLRQGELAVPGELLV